MVDNFLTKEIASFALKIGGGFEPKARYLNIGSCLSILLESKFAIRYLTLSERLA
jgi:hypothetical protein